MIRPYLRDLIDEHEPITESNNNDNNNNNDKNNNSSNNNSNNSNNTNSNNNSNSNSNIRAEWKIQLIIKNNFIFVKDFEDTCTIYAASKLVEIFRVVKQKRSLIRFLIQF